MNMRERVKRLRVGKPGKLLDVRRVCRYHRDDLSGVVLHSGFSRDSKRLSVQNTNQLRDGNRALDWGSAKMKMGAYRSPHGLTESHGDCIFKSAFDTG
jgi:hypothetical protein